MDGPVIISSAHPIVNVRMRAWTNPRTLHEGKERPSEFNATADPLAPSGSVKKARTRPVD